MQAKRYNVSSCTRGLSHGHVVLAFDFMLSSSFLRQQIDPESRAAVAQPIFVAKSLFYYFPLQLHTHVRPSRNLHLASFPLTLTIIAELSLFPFPSLPSCYHEIPSHFFLRPAPFYRRCCPPHREHIVCALPVMLSCVSCTSNSPTASPLEIKSYTQILKTNASPRGRL